MIASVAAGLALSACQSTGGGAAGQPTGDPAKRQWRTRDLGAVTADCSKVVNFVASLNDDDDNASGQPDLKKTLPIKDKAGQDVEEGLRRVDFPEVAGAKTVKVFKPAENRVRLYEKDRSTVYQGQALTVPATIYIEGIAASTKTDDTGIEYSYFDADDKPVCGKLLAGTIIKVAPTFQPTGNAPAVKANKLLIGGTGKVDATLTPADGDLTPGWSADPAAAVTFAAPNAATGAFTAGTTPTPADHLDQDTVKVTFTGRGAIAGQSIEAYEALNLTAPHRVHVKKGDSFSGQAGPLAANADDTNIFDQKIVYEMDDQFGAKVKEQSAYGGSTPEARENIAAVLTTPIPALNAYVATLRHNAAWTLEPEATIADTIRAAKFPVSALTTKDQSGRLVFVPAATGPNAPIMNLGGGTHIWTVGVHTAAGADAADTQTTMNTFSLTSTVETTGSAPPMLTFSYAYAVHLVP